MKVAVISAVACVLLVLGFLVTWSLMPTSDMTYTPDHQQEHNLTHLFDAYNDSRSFDHWMQHSKAYQRNVEHLFSQPAGLDGKSTIHVLSIGVQGGGSIGIWSAFFGKRLRYTGIDADSASARFESSSEGIHIETVSQPDPQTMHTFPDPASLRRVCTDHGPFDLIIDSIGHRTHSILSSLDVLWLCLRDKGVYAIEDLHTMAIYAGPEMYVNGTDFVGHLSRLMYKMVEHMEPHSSAAAAQSSTPRDRYAQHLAGIHVYDSIAFLQYRHVWSNLTRIQRGHKFGLRKLASAQPHFVHVGIDVPRIIDAYDEAPGLETFEQYGAHYQWNFRHLFHAPLHSNNSKVHVLELGVSDGGFTRVWHEVFGHRLDYTGLDKSSAASRLENSAEGIRIKIGSQSDILLLRNICSTHGPFDLIIDKSHTTKAILTSFDALWPCMRDKGVYVVQDLFTMAANKGGQDMLVEGLDFYGHLERWIRGMMEYWTPGRDPGPPSNLHTRHLAAAHVYDSIAFLHYQAEWSPLTRVLRGSPTKQ